MSQKSSSQKSFKLPWWLQLALGLAFVFVIYLIAISSNSYLSAWDEEDSNFYATATQALKMFSIHPTAPTAIIFWEKDCEECQSTIRAFQGASSNLRVYGVHLANGEREVEIRKAWLRIAPRTSATLIDKSELIQTSFHVKSVPWSFIILPKQKKIFSYWGDASKARQRMLEIIKSE